MEHIRVGIAPSRWKAHGEFTREHRQPNASDTDENTEDKEETLQRCQPSHGRLTETFAHCVLTSQSDGGLTGRGESNEPPLPSSSIRTAHQTRRCRLHAAMRPVERD